MKKDKYAVVLLSGGLDSATTLALARNEGFQCYALTFSYGQRHKWEIEAAKRIANSTETIEHRIIDIDLAQFGGSALTNSAIEVPKDRADLGKPDHIPPTYVPSLSVLMQLTTALIPTAGRNLYPPLKSSPISPLPPQSATKANIEFTRRL
jgi:7-cyano-7-deazaguanine synthase